MLEHNNFRDSLLAEVNELQQQKAQLIKNLKQAPEGSLNVLEKTGKKPQYYWYQGRTPGTIEFEGRTVQSDEPD